jgi:hypothetical protein
MIPATIPRWSRFVTFISVLIPASSFWLFSNYFTLPLRAECGIEEDNFEEGLVNILIEAGIKKEDIVTSLTSNSYSTGLQR